MRADIELHGSKTVVLGFLLCTLEESVSKGTIESERDMSRR